jgi:hypothetical protein
VLDIYVLQTPPTFLGPKIEIKITDVSETVVRRIGLAAGLVDNKVCAIDEIWSGLRFVTRIKDRKK